MIDDDLEDRLREALRYHATEAPPGGAMLAGVAAESARRGRRARLAALAAGAATLVALAAAAPSALRAVAPAPAAGTVDVAEGALGGAAEPPATFPAASAASSAATGAVPATLARSTVPASVTFPYAPPSGPGYGTPSVTLTAGHVTVDQDLPGDAGTAWLTLYDAAPPAPSSRAVAAAATVHGGAATVYEWRLLDDDPSGLPDPQRTLVWQPAAGAWLSLTEGPSARPAADLVAYAEAIGAGTAGSVTPSTQAPFGFELMPAGWTVDNITPGVVTFCPPGVRPDGSFEDKIAVTLEETSASGSASADPQAQRVAVGTRQGWLTTSAEGQVLHVPVEGGRSLVLQAGPRAVLPLGVLARFAAGISVAPAAQVSRG